MDIQFHGVAKRFGSVWANRDITMDLQPETIVGLLGPNGAGKTAPLRQLVGLVRPTAGYITIGGRVVSPGRPWLKEIIAYLPQHPLALGDLTIEEAIRSSALLRGQRRRQADHNTEVLLESFGLRPLRRRQLVGLSGGEHRLAGIASVVVAPTPILVLDEPTNEFDPLMRRRVWSAIEGLRSSERVILMVSHNVLEAERILDRVLIMSHGSIRHDGSPTGLGERAGELITVSLTTTRDIEVLADSALSISDHVDIRPSSLEFTAPRTAALPWLARWLPEPGRVSRVSVTEPTLEDAYLALRDDKEGLTSS